MIVLAIATLVASCVLLLATAFLIVGDYQLVVRLRENHRKAWEKLGSPSPWFTRLEDLTSVYRFLVARDDRQLGDAQLSALADRIRLLTYAVYALTAVIFVLMLLIRLSK
ncbi:MAG: hypothetical protein ACJ785_11150 [Gemmatimonadaceae bacterium]